MDVIEVVIVAFVVVVFFSLFSLFFCFFVFFSFTNKVKTELEIYIVLKKRICKKFARSFFGYCASIGAEKKALKTLYLFVNKFGLFYSWDSSIKFTCHCFHFIHLFFILARQLLILIRSLVRRFSKMLSKFLSLSLSAFFLSFFYWKKFCDRFFLHFHECDDIICAKAMLL